MMEDALRDKIFIKQISFGGRERWHGDATFGEFFLELFIVLFGFPEVAFEAIQKHKEFPFLQLLVEQLLLQTFPLSQAPHQRLPPCFSIQITLIMLSLLILFDPAAERIDLISQITPCPCSYGILQFLGKALNLLPHLIVFPLILEGESLNVLAKELSEVYFLMDGLSLGLDFIHFLVLDGELELSLGIFTKAIIKMVMQIGHFGIKLLYFCLLFAQVCLQLSDFSSQRDHFCKDMLFGPFEQTELILLRRMHLISRRKLNIFDHICRPPCLLAIAASSTQKVTIFVMLGRQLISTGDEVIVQLLIRIFLAGEVFVQL